MPAMMERIVAPSSFRRRRTVVSNRSPFNGATYDSGFQDWQWVFSFTYQPMPRQKAAALLAEIAQQDEGTGSFVAWDPAWPSPLSGYTGTGLVNGAAQTGMTLVSDGWVPGALVAAAADYIYVPAGSLHLAFRLKQAAVANGAGQISFSLDAPLRVSPADNAVIRLTPGGSVGIRAKMLSYEVQAVDRVKLAIKVTGEERV